MTKTENQSPSFEILHKVAIFFTFPRDLKYCFKIDCDGCEIYLFYCTIDTLNIFLLVYLRKLLQNFPHHEIYILSTHVHAHITRHIKTQKFFIIFTFYDLPQIINLNFYLKKKFLLFLLSIFYASTLLDCWKLTE